MIEIDKAKANILSIAFRGELIRIEDRIPKNEALKQIHERCKKFEAVKEEEFLIETPIEWNWSRIGYVTYNHGQKTPNETFSYIDVGTLDNINQRLPEEENIIEAKDAPSRAKKIVEFGDVLYSTVRPYLHNICIVDKNFSYTPIASTAFAVMHVNEKVLNNRFLFYWLLTPEFDKFANGNRAKGTLYPAIGEKDFLNGVIPIPSMDEQKRIVQIIDETFALMNDIREFQNRYENDKNVLKRRLIDAGIRGKLTEQLSEDGKAADLLIKLKGEISAVNGNRRKEAIKAKKLLFDIPDNWEWCRLSDIAYTNIGLTYHPEDVSENGTIVIRSSNIQNGKLDYNDIVRVKCPIKENQYLNNNDIVICVRNGSKALVGKCAIFEGKDKEVSFGAFMALLRTPCYKYVYYYLHTQAFRRYFAADDTKQINQVTQNILKNAFIPLPPLAEQRRIVERIEELLQYCQ